MPKTRGRLLVSVVAAATLVLTLLPLGAQPAGAVAPTSAPTGLSPSGETVGGNPQLSWDAVDGAVRYRVQVDDTANFSSPLSNVITFNTTFAPPTALPVGTIHWRVAGLDAGSGQGPWSGEASFTRQMDAPLPSTPADNAVIDYPGTATTFSWSPTPETKSYMLEIDDALGFPSPKQVVTRTTSHTPIDLEAPGRTYYWRVRSSSATNGGGITSAWSPVRAFDLQWAWVDGIRIQAPVAISPTPNQNLTDVAFDWKPVPGATAYNLEVDLTIGFNDPSLRVTNSHSSHFVVPSPLANQAYWWRVQAVDPDGNLGPWSQPRQFTRSWLASPTHVFPAAGAGPTTGGDLTLEWSSVDHASTYDVQLSGDQFFNAPTTCRTVRTRIQVGSGCNFNTTNDFYWRIRALDDGGGIPVSPIIGVWSGGRFHEGHTKTAVSGTFVPANAPTLLSPADSPNDCTEEEPADEEACKPWSATPTFSWAPVPGATSYRLYVATDPNFTSVLADFSEILTNQTTYTHPNELPDNDAGKSYYWYVQPCATTCGPSPLGANPPLESFTFRKSSIRVRPLSPANGVGTVVANFPRFRWQPYLETTSVENVDPDPGSTDLEAYRYQIQVSRVPTFETLIDDKITNQPAYTPWDRTYEEGPIYWRVRAIDGSQNPLAWSQATVEDQDDAPWSFTKRSPVPLPSSPASGATVSGSVTLRWATIPFASGYDVEIYREVDGQPSFSPANRVLRTVTEQVNANSVAQLPPGTYRWRLRRSDADGRWGEWSNDAAAHGVAGGPSFVVSPAAPGLLAPANNALVSGNDLLFSWTGVNGAATYRFQRSTDAAFTTPQNTTTVMTSNAPTDQWALGTYYWRVQAYDANDQLMGTSAARIIRKNALPAAPTGLVATRGNLSANLAWAPPPPTTPPGSPVTGYRVTPYIGGTAQPTRFFSGTGTSATVTGLTNGTTYRFRVAAVNLGGDGALSDFSNNVTPSPGPSLPPGAVYVPVTPCRVVDTRVAIASMGKMSSGQIRDYRIAGSGEQFQQQGGNNGGCAIPDGVDAVEVSVTALDQTQGGYFRAWPTGEAQPNATFLNYTKGKAVTNTGAIKLAPTGVNDLRVTNSGGPSHYVIDVQGYYADSTSGSVPGGTVYVPITPCRVVDTRALSPLVNGAQRNYRVAGSGLSSQGGAAGGCQIPEAASAVEASVTATAQTNGGYFRAWPSGQAMPNATFLNYTRNQGITNTGAIKVATTGATELAVRNFGSTSHYIIDVQGYFIDATAVLPEPGSVYVPVTPCRVVDTRVRGGVFRANQSRNYRVAGVSTVILNQGGREGGCGIPEDAGAVEASVTAVSPTGNGFFRAFPAGTAEPNATFLNYATGAAITNTGAIKVSTTNSNDLTVKNFSSASHYVIDVQGYFVALPPAP